MKSSTRTELAAAIVAILQCCSGRKRSQIIKYYEDKVRMNKRIRGRKEARRNKLEIEAKYTLQKTWRLSKDADLWEMFAKAVEARGPGCTRTSKAKGHATQEMVDEGQVQKEDKKGNDQADRGAVTMQKVTRKLADLYSWRHGGCRNFNDKDPEVNRRPDKP